MKRSLILAAFMAAALPAAAHEHGGGHSHEASPAATGVVHIQDAWARAAIAGGNGAVYGRIVNDTDEPDRLIAVKGKVSNAVEIHEMSTEDGVMKMRKLEALDIPARGSAELKPGGNHIMLIGLNDKGLPEGEMLALTFVFEKRGKVAMMIPIRKAGDGGHDEH